MAAPAALTPVPHNVQSLPLRLGNDLCELLCKKVDIRQDRAWRVDQMALFFLATLSAVGEFASGVLLQYVTECRR